jgi:hypothetical protein
MALKDVIIATQADLRDNPEHANATFAADSRQVDGLRSETKIRQFSLTIDEPANLGGTDTGPNPVELVLAALAARRTAAGLGFRDTCFIFLTRAPKLMVCPSNSSAKNAADRDVRPPTPPAAPSLPSDRACHAYSRELPV